MSVVLKAKLPAAMLWSNFFYRIGVNILDSELLRLISPFFLVSLGLKLSFNCGMERFGLSKLETYYSELKSWSLNLVVLLPELPPLKFFFTI